MFNVSSTDQFSKDKYNVSDFINGKPPAPKKKEPISKEAIADWLKRSRNINFSLDVKEDSLIYNETLDQMDKIYKYRFVRGVKKGDTLISMIRPDFDPIVFVFNKDEILEDIVVLQDPDPNRLTSHTLQKNVPSYAIDVTVDTSL